MATLARVGVLAAMMLLPLGAAGGFEDALREAFVPRRGLAERYSALREDLSQKFPFSVALQLQGWSAGLSEAQGDVLGGHIGPIPLPDSGAISPLFSYIRDGMGLVILVSTVVWLANRVAPRVRI